MKNWGPLLQALQYWGGLDRVRSRLEERGYCIHRLYQEELRTFCAERGLRGDLDTYWEEAANEYVASAGLRGTRGAAIDQPGVYRSAYLDALDSAFDETKYSHFDQPPTKHPCLYDYYVDREKRDGGSEFRQRVEAAKQIEYAQVGLTSERWTGYRRDIVPIMESAAIACGFERENVRRKHSHLASRGYAKRLASGLLFYFGLQAGGLKFWPPSLSLEFRVAHRAAEDAEFFVGDFYYILPGVHLYATYTTAESAVLGVHALIETFDAFVQSFDN